MIPYREASLMTPVQFWGIFIFSSVVLGVFFFTSLVVGREAWFALRGRRRFSFAALERHEQALVACAVLGLCCMLYGKLVEPYWLKVTRVKLRSTKIAAGSRPVRVMHLTDIHSESSGPRLEPRVAALARELKPDVIVFTGDSLNGPGGLPVLRGLLAELGRVAPVYAVKGNWDVWHWSQLNLFGAIPGVTELNGDGAVVKVGGSRVWLGGVAVESEARLDGLVQKLPTDAYHIFLYHYPDLIPDLAARGGIDLYLAGHTHGGQVALPGWGAIATFSKLGKRFEHGYYREREMSAYVSAGVGLEGNHVPRVRFYARPEVVLLEISPEK